LGSILFMRFAAPGRDRRPSIERAGAERPASVLTFNVRIVPQSMIGRRLDPGLEMESIP